MTSARFARRATFLVAIAALITAIAIAPTRAQAAGTVRIADKPTGLSVKAPKGYKLAHANGYYTLTGKGSFAVFARGVSPLSVQATGAALVKSSGGKLVGKAASSAKLYKATIVSGKRIYVLFVRPAAGGTVDMTLVGPGTPPKLAKDARLVRLSLTQLRQVAALDAIVRSRRGGAAALVNIPIPMRLAATLDNLASANVPATPGWVVDGGNGIFAVTHPDLGFGWFGITIAAATPAFSFARPGIDIIVPPGTPATTLQSGFTQYVNLSLKQQFEFQQIAQIAGSENILGPSIPSAMFQVRFTWRGVAHQGLFLWGITNQTDVLQKFYFSGIAVTDNAPGSYSNALLQTWASSNGTAGFREQFSTTLENLADRPDREFILTPSRFRSDASTWISLLASGAR